MHLVCTLLKVKKPKTQHSTRSFGGVRKNSGGSLDLVLSGQQKGPAEMGHVKQRQKSSKSDKYIFDTFRLLLRWARKIKNWQKVSKRFSTFLTIFARHQFSGPFFGASDGTFSSPIRFAPPYHGPIVVTVEEVSCFTSPAIPPGFLSRIARKNW